ncbi:MAG: hypothetical protein COA84_01585 [Robiginitomaculum sp.]|nr:MAG: hypothetical protein COA84_01585 [Robiginitomaculum sp.]
MAHHNVLIIGIGTLGKTALAHMNMVSEGSEKTPTLLVNPDTQSANDENASVSISGSDNQYALSHRIIDHITCLPQRPKAILLIAEATAQNLNEMHFISAFCNLAQEHGYYVTGLVFDGSLRLSQTKPEKPSPRLGTYTCAFDRFCRFNVGDLYQLAKADNAQKLNQLSLADFAIWIDQLFVTYADHAVHFYQTIDMPWESQCS